MASLGGLLAGAAGPLAKRVLQSLGLGMVTFAGLDIVFSQLRDLVITNWNNIPADVLAIASLGGYGDAVGIILGAIGARISYASLSHIGKV